MVSESEDTLPTKQSDSTNRHETPQLLLFYVTVLMNTSFISFAENVGRLKKLEYLNLALNIVERIENLEGQQVVMALPFGDPSR